MNSESSARSCDALLALSCCASLAAAHAQLAVPADVNLFGDEIVKKVEVQNNGFVFRRVITVVGEKKPARVAGLTHLLLFQDGRQLRGELHALTKDEVLWKRPDAGKLLRIGRGEVRRIFLTPPDSEQSGPFFPTINNRIATPQSGAVNSRPTPATVKLPGCDWLHGDVISADGRTFEFTLKSGGKLNIPREQIEWLYFDDKPAPAVSFPASPLAMDEWLSRTGKAKIEIADGTLVVQDPPLLARKLAAQLPARFEIAIEVPEDAEEGTRLVLQPNDARTNYYTRGTVDLRFGSTELARCIYSHGSERKKTPVPDAATAPGSVVKYRVLYDGLDEQLSVLRNGTLLGQWPLIEEADRAAAGRSFKLHISAVCIEREHRGISGPLKLKSLRVQPWDGALPQAGEPAPTRDVFSGFKEAPIEGTLEVLADNGVVFSGDTKMRRAGALLRFPNQPPPLADADAHLLFGAEGEFAVADLEVRDGRARCRTSFTAAFDAPTTTLETIAFSARADDGPSPADVLVFKNGDELRGTLLAAASGQPLRWKMACGQELDLDTARVVGVRLGGEMKSTADAATVELRNGDRLRGEFAALDADTLFFKHARLGLLSIARESAWMLHPRRAALPIDGGCDASLWLQGPLAGAIASNISAPNDPKSWICIDGQYVCRRVEQGTPFGASGGIGRKLAGAGERFELRFDATDLRGDASSFSIRLSSGDASASVSLSGGTGSWYLYVFDPKAAQPVASQRIQLSDKFKNMRSRVSVRVFVDRKAGTAAFFLDGLLLAKTGRQVAGLGESVSFGAGSFSTSRAVFSNLAILPWNGELPGKDADTGPRTVLVNGDVALGAPVELRDGKFLIESEDGLFEPPAEKVQAIEFGGVFAPERAGARIRLADGCALHVDAFRFDHRELTAHSAILGAVRIPAAEVSELILDAAPVRSEARR